MQKICRGYLRTSKSSDTSLLVLGNDEKKINWIIDIPTMLWKYSGKIDPIQLGNELLQLLSLPLGEPVPHWTFEPETHPDVWLIGHSHCLSKADYWLIMIDSFLKFITPVIRPAKQAFIIILILLLLIFHYLHCGHSVIFDLQDPQMRWNWRLHPNIGALAICDGQKIANIIS